MLVGGSPRLAAVTTFTKVMWSGAFVLAAVVLALWGAAAGSPANAPPHRLGYVMLACPQRSHPESQTTCARPLPYPYRGG